MAPPNHVSPCASGIICVCPWFHPEGWDAHKCSTCNEPVHAFCYGTNDEFNSKRCAKCVGSVMKNAIPPPQAPAWFRQLSNSPSNLAKASSHTATSSMANQSTNLKKRKKPSTNKPSISHQASLTSFFSSTKPVIRCTTTVAGNKSNIYTCGLCGRTMSSQGWPNHQRMHIDHGELKEGQATIPYKSAKDRSRPTGSVKIRGPLVQKDIINLTNDEHVADDGQPADDGQLADDGQQAKIRKKYSNWKIDKKVEVLDYLHNIANGNIKKTCRWVKATYNMESCAPSLIRYWIKTEIALRETASKDRTYVVAGAMKKREGLFPDMELELAQLIKDLRKSGMPVSTWMVRADGKDILSRMYPNVQFKFSNGWER